MLRPRLSPAFTQFLFGLQEKKANPSAELYKLSTVQSLLSPKHTQSLRSPWQTDTTSRMSLDYKPSIFLERLQIDILHFPYPALFVLADSRKKKYPNASVCKCSILSQGLTLILCIHGHWIVTCWVPQPRFLLPEVKPRPRWLPLSQDHLGWVSSNWRSGNNTVNQVKFVCSIHFSLSSFRVRFQYVY